MQINNHETQKGTIVISNPNAAAIKFAKQLETKKNAKFRANGDIVTFSAYRRDFEKFAPAVVKPVVKPTYVAPTNDELAAKIAQCEAEIVRLEAYAATIDRTDVRTNVDYGDTMQEIRLNRERIEILRKRIAGIPLTTVTDEQLALMDYVLSDKYNDD